MVVTSEQVNALNLHEMSMPGEKAGLVPREESIPILRKLVLGRRPVQGERAKMVRRPKPTQKGKILLIGKVSTLIQPLKR
jgi:hypothetical protein